MFFEGSSFKTTRSAWKPAAIRPSCFVSPNRSAGRSRQGSENLAEAHSRFGHQGILLGGIVVHSAEIISEENRPPRGNPSPQLADDSFGNLLLSRYAVVARVVLPYPEGWCQGDSTFLHGSKDRFVPWAGVGSGVSDGIDPRAHRGEHVHTAIGVNKDRFPN
jgi:hypothetical protein